MGMQREIYGIDRNLSELQSNTLEISTRVTRNPFYSAIQATDLPLTAGVVNLIAHGLGRRYNGFVVTRNKDQFALLYEFTPTAAIPVDLAVYLPIVTAFTVTVDLVIY